MQVESPASYTLISVTTYYWQKPVPRVDKFQSSICLHGRGLERQLRIRHELLVVSVNSQPHV